MKKKNTLKKFQKHKENSPDNRMTLLYMFGLFGYTEIAQILKIIEFHKRYLQLPLYILSPHEYIYNIYIRILYQKHTIDKEVKIL